MTLRQLSYRLEKGLTLRQDSDSLGVFKLLRHRRR